MRLRFVFLLFALGCGLAQETHAQATIFIVRHAEKATSGDPKDPDLSDAGRVRAEALATTLRDADIKAIYVSEFKRSRQTAEPLARVRNIDIRTVAAKESGSLLEQLKEASGNVLVVGHSNTIPEILKSFGLAADVVITDEDYDNLFVVVPGAPPQLLRLHF
ncbi:MAG TPA: phosphoglycerate mutase family protein, partial [Chthoniobacterales bacterium]